MEEIPTRNTFKSLYVVSSVCAPHLHSPAVLLFHLFQEVLLKLQISAFILDVWLQRQTPHDPLTVGVKQDAVHNILWYYDRPKYIFLPVMLYEGNWN